MSRCRRLIPFIPLVALVCAAPTFAGFASGDPPPECEGISNVYASNPDMIGDLTTVRVASGLLQPVAVAFAPGDDERMFVVEQNGLIRIVKDGVLNAAPFIDLNAVSACCGERGLLGLAFHPDYQTNRFFFVYYTANDGTITIARYERNALDPDLAVPGTATIVKTIPHPISNHNGGTVAFSPIDGHLYFAVGDGGSACDPGPGTGNAQDLTSDLGKLHRLNVDTVPVSTNGNPFHGSTFGNDSIWAYGLRNPFRFSFDRLTGNVLIGDVGQNAREEFNCGNATPGGQNYGWATHEGNTCGTCPGSGVCNPSSYVPPIQEYNWFGGASAIGGYVYRGCRMGPLHGTYFFADFGAFIRSLRLPNQATCPASVGSFIDRAADLAPGGGLSIAQVPAFGEDHQGELYVVDYGGEVFKILPNLNIMEVSGPNAMPLTMSSESSWSWENLGNSYENTLSQYRIYRSLDGPQGTFNCIGRILASSCTNTCSWTGDPTQPGPDEVFYYLITVTGTGGESTAGAASDGTLRVVNTASSCQL